MLYKQCINRSSLNSKLRPMSMSRLDMQYELHGDNTVTDAMDMKRKARQKASCISMLWVWKVS